MFTSCQLFNTLGVEVNFTRKWEVSGDCLTYQELVGVTWRVSDCEELVGVTHRISLGKSHDLS